MSFVVNLDFPSASLAFEKWHGLGNDFIVIDEADAAWADHAVALCSRHRGVGADGVLIVSRSPEAMRVVNADGSEPEMCGNGLRCVAAHLATSPGAFDILTGAGALRVDVRERDGFPWVETCLGQGVRGAAAVGGAGDALSWTDDAAGAGWLVSMGNPHWVFLEPPAEALLEAHGPRLEHDERFGNRTNVEWLYPIGEHAWRAAVWERGCGRTQACGTGAAASALALVYAGNAPRERALRIELLGGALEVRVGEDDRVWVAGPARRVFAGRVRASELAAAR